MSRVALRYKPNRPHALQRLPFVGERHGRWGLWGVPLQGGYGGYEAGIALAQILLIHLRQQPEKSQDSASLVEGMLLGMLDKARGADDEQFRSLSWQALGFMRQIAPYIIGAAHHACDSVDDLDPREVLKRANAGLNWQPEA